MFRSIIVRALYLAIVFIANLLLANILKPLQFGTITSFIINAAVVSLLTGLGIDSLIMYSIANKKWSINYSFSVVWLMIGLQMFFFILLQIISISLFGVTFLSKSSGSTFYLEVIYFFGLIAVEKYLALFYSLRKTILINTALLLITGFYCFALLFCYFNLKTSYSLILGLFAFQSFLQAVLVIILFKRVHPSPRLQRHRFIELFEVIKLSSVVMITNSIQFLAYRIDFFLIKSFYSDYELGIYAQANKFANLIWIFPNIIAPMLFARFKDVGEANIPLLFRWCSILNFLIALLTILGTEFCYAFLLDASYTSGIKSFYLMLPGYICWALVIYFATYFSFLGKFKYNLIASSYCFLSILIFDLILIPLYGINGAAIANTISYTSALAINIFLFLKEEHVTLQSLINIQRKDLIFLRKLYKNE